MGAEAVDHRQEVAFFSVFALSAMLSVCVAKQAVSGSLSARTASWHLTQQRQAAWML
jgi:hypothetical protein